MDLRTDFSGDSDSKESFTELMNTEISQAVFSLSARRQKEQLFTHFTFVARGELEKVQRGLSEGVSIDATDENGRSALHVAASSGQMEVASFLIDSGASTRIVDKYKNMPLADSVRGKHDAISQLLRDCEPDMELNLSDRGGNAVQLINAAYHHDLEQVERLIKFGVDVNDSDYDQRTALHIAASEGFVEVVDFLLKTGAHVNAIDRFGGSPLADTIRDRSDYLNSSHFPDANLSLIARHDHNEVQFALKAAGGVLIGVDAGALLCELAATGSLSELEAYCSSGIDINSHDYDGRTALHLAASEGRINVLDYLLQAPDIDVNSVDRYGSTPLGKKFSLHFLPR